MQTYEFSDKFIVYAPDGTVAFDSRNMSQRIHLTSVVDIGGRTSVPVFNGPVGLNPSAVAVIPFNKTFSRPPYVLSALRKFAVDDENEEFPTSRIYPPRILYRDIAFFGAGGYLKGHFTNSQTNVLGIGNVSPSGNIAFVNVTRTYRGEKRAWYAVFENEVA